MAPPYNVQLLPACARPAHFFAPKPLIIKPRSSGSWIALSAAMRVPGSGSQLSVAKITGQGLTSIAVLVALLWTCAIGERVMLGRANACAAQVVRAMRELRSKNRREPAATPQRPSHRPVRAEAG